MISTFITSRFILYLPPICNDNATGKVKSFVNAFKSLDLTAVESEQFCVAFENSSKHPIVLDEKPFLLLDVPLGKIHSGRRFALNTPRPNWEKWHEVATTESQLYNLSYFSSENVRIESDLLGLKRLFWAETEYGTLVSSRLADLFVVSPALVPSVDQDAIAQFMIMGYTFGQRTLHTHVHRTRTGECLSWSPKVGLKFDRSRRYTIPENIRSDVSFHQAISDLDAALDQSLARYTAGAKSPFNIGLSGGFDSRILAATIQRRGSAVRTFTYGKWHHRDLRTARRIAKLLGVEHNVLDYPIDNFYRQLPLFMSTVEGHGDSKTTQIANLLQLDAPQGSALIHGFLSDPIAGSHLSDWFQTDGIKSLDEVADRLAHVLAPERRQLELTQNILGFNIKLDEFKNEIRSDLLDSCNPYQSALMWDIENRQRGLISPHLLMLGAKFDVVVPYYDTKLLQMWITMPRLGLDKRYLQRQLLALQYPELAKVPRDEEFVPIIPNLKNQLLLLIDTQIRKVFLRLYGKLAGYRPQSIWSLSQGLADRSQKKKMISAIESGKPEAESTLNLQFDLSPSILNEIEVAPDYGNVHTPRLVFQIIEYAKWLRQLPEKPRVN